MCENKHYEETLRTFNVERVQPDIIVPYLSHFFLSKRKEGRSDKWQQNLYISENEKEREKRESDGEGERERKKSVKKSSREYFTFSKQHNYKH